MKILPSIISLLTLLSFVGGIDVSATPSNSPSGGSPQGVFYQYFSNMAQVPLPVNPFLKGFSPDFSPVYGGGTTFIKDYLATLGTNPTSVVMGFTSDGTLKVTPVSSLIRAFLGGNIGPAPTGYAIIGFTPGGRPIYSTEVGYWAVNDPTSIIYNDSVQIGKIAAPANLEVVGGNVISLSSPSVDDDLITKEYADTILKNMCTSLGGFWNDGLALCSQTALPPGACGSSNGGSFASAPSSNLCGNGNTASSVTDGGTTWNWTCANGTTVSCSATKSVPNSNLGCQAGGGSFINGVSWATYLWDTGSSSYGSVYHPSLYTTNQDSNPNHCGATAWGSTIPEGGYTVISDTVGPTTGTMRLNCNGSTPTTYGTISVDNATCNNPTTVVNGTCNPTYDGQSWTGPKTWGSVNDLCTSGTQTIGAGWPDGGLTGVWTWSCVGSGVGHTDASCSATSTAIWARMYNTTGAPDCSTRGAGNTPGDYTHCGSNISYYPARCSSGGREYICTEPSTSKWNLEPVNGVNCNVGGWGDIGSFCNPFWNAIHGFRTCTNGSYNYVYCY